MAVDYPLTRAEFRDAVRRKMSQVPPVDDGVGIAGAQPVENPFPSNPLLNQCLNEAVAFLSRKGRLARDPVPRSIGVGAQTADGPYYTSLSMVSPAFSVNEVLRVAWIPSGGEEQQLTPASREDMDRTLKNYMTQAAGTPQRYWTEGGYLMVGPSPSAAGTLSLMLGTRLWSQSQNLDGEYVDIIPSDYQPLVTLKTVSFICDTQPDDSILKELKAGTDIAMADGMFDFMAWARRQNRSVQARMVPRTNRMGVIAGRR